MTTPNDDFKLVLFYADWCGHCKNYFLKDSDNKPLTIEDIQKKKEDKVIPSNVYTWQEIKEEIQAKCSILIEEYEEGDLNGKYSSDIDGYPTIAILKKSGNNYVFFTKFTKNRSKSQDFVDLIQECRGGNNRNTISSDVDSEFTLALFYADWCGYCKNYFIKDSDKKPLDLNEILEYKKKENIKDSIYLWQEVKDSVKNNLKINVIELEESDPEIESYRSAFKGWPTIFMLKKEGSKLIPYKKFEKNRSDINDIQTFINVCIKNKQNGGTIDTYRLKYKKYKENYIILATKYNNLLNKYKQLQ